MAITIETNEQYEAAALRLGELSRAQVESIDHAEFEAISMAMMGFEASRLALVEAEAKPGSGLAAAPEI